jgi:hypothetical protein
LPHLSMTQYCASVGDQPVPSESDFWNPILRLTVQYFYRMLWLFFTADEAFQRYLSGYQIE